MLFLDHFINIFDNAKKKIGQDTLEFSRHFSNYLVNVVWLSILSIISLPIFTRLLNTSEYGTLSVFFSTLSILIVITGLGFKVAIKRYYFETKDDFYEMLCSNLLFLAFTSIIFINIAYILRNLFSSFLKLSPIIIIIVFLVSIFDIFWEIYLNYLQASQRSRQYSIINIFKQSLIFLLSIVWIYSLKKDKYLGGIYATLFITSIFSCYVCYLFYKMSRYNFKFNHIKYSLEIGIPILPSMLSSFILTYFDVIIINQLTNDSNAGLYAFAYKIGMFLNVIIIAGSRAWQPMFYDKLNKNEYKIINGVIKNYLNFIYLIASALILFSNEIVIILSDKKFHSALDLVPIIILGYVFYCLYTIYGQYTVFRKKTYYNSIYALICAFLNVGLNYWLIPKYGYAIAAYTTFISYFVLFALFYLNVRFILKEEHFIPLKTIIPNLSYVFIAIGIFFYSRTMIFNYLTAFSLKVASIILIGAIFLGKYVKKI